METLIAPETPNSSPKLTHRFTCDGHEYKLYRIPALPTGVWYIHFIKRGRRYKRSLDTTIQKTAEANARRIIAAVKDQRWDALSAARSKTEFADLESIIAAYEKAPDRPDPKTVARNVYCFRLLIRRATDKTNLAGVSAAILTDKLIRDFKSAVLKSIPADAGEIDSNRAKRSANSIWRQARSLFAKKIQPSYADAKLKLPDLKKFMNEPGFHGVANPDYQIPDDALIQRTFRGIHKLRTSGHPEKLNRFKVAALALGGGLRAGEMGEASWDWFTTIDNRPFLRGDKLGKNGRGIDIPFQAEVWQWLQSIKPEGAKPADRILIVNCKTDVEKIFRKISKWMRKLGWKTQKTIHELRAYIGSKVAQKHGIIAARDLLRHATSDITERSYGRYITTKNVDVQLAQN